MDREWFGIIVLVAFIAIVVGVATYSYITPAELSGIQYSNGTIVPVLSPAPTPTAYPVYYIYRNGTWSPYTVVGSP